MKFKDILKELEDIEDNKEKISYLNKLLKEIQDKDLIKQVKELIKEFEEDLEGKLEEEIVITPSRKREIELDDAEHDIEIQEEQIRPRVQRQTINLNAEENREVRYENNVTYQTRIQAPVYQGNQISTAYELMSQQLNMKIGLIEEVLIKERDFNIGQVINESQREEIKETIDKIIPHASPEEKIMAEKKVIYNLQSKEHKYMTKLK